MSEIHSALVWEKGSRGISPLTVTLQEVESRGVRLAMALVCEGEEGGICPQLAAGYLCERMVGWFYSELLPFCNKNMNAEPEKLEPVVQNQWERALKEWREYAEKRGLGGDVTISGLVLWGTCFVAFGNRPVYVLNKRFNRPRRKNILSSDKSFSMSAGRIGSFLSLYLENDGMKKVLKEEELLESLYTEELMVEEKLEKRLFELGKAALQRGQGKCMGAVILEVKP